MDINTLKQMQQYPLWMKVEKTKRRIQEWYEHWDGQVYVSFSGGKDSTVLVDIARKLYPDIPVVFVNTGVEYPEVVKHVRSYENITILRPTKPFHKVLQENGYPVISKNVSRLLCTVQRNGKDCKTGNRFKPNNEYNFYDYSKYAYLIDAPFKISDSCCNYLKKLPVHHYEKETGNHPILGNMAEESLLRKKIYLGNGCNAFNLKRPISTPLGFWTEQDILQYIVENDISIPTVYGEIRRDSYDNYMTTGLNRTGCMYCPFGVQHEKYPNRYQRLQHTHPKHYEFMLNKLGFKQVFEYCGIEYKDRQNRLF